MTVDQSKIALLGPSSVKFSLKVYLEALFPLNKQFKKTRDRRAYRHGKQTTEIAFCVTGNKWSGKNVDTIGMEKYQDLMPQYYRSVHGFILVYDITNRPSFKHLDTLFTDVDTFATIEGNVKIIVGNKIDLGKSRTVPRSEGLKYAHSKGALFIETSALSNEAVDHIFEKLVTEVMKNPKLWTSPISQTIQIVNSPPVTPSTSCNC